MLERKKNIHFCCKCGKGMEYAEKQMVYLYRVHTETKYLRTRGKSSIHMYQQSVPKAQRAHNLCEECAKQLNVLLDDFFAKETT